jgi:hypothetical protein
VFGKQAYIRVLVGRALALLFVLLFPSPSVPHIHNSLHASLTCAD